MVWDLQKPASNNDGRRQRIDINLQKHKFHEISAISKKLIVYLCAQPSRIFQYLTEHSILAAGI